MVNSFYKILITPTIDLNFLYSLKNFYLNDNSSNFRINISSDWYFKSNKFKS